MREAYGIYYGKVSNIDDPEERGRIKCVIPQILGADTESAWCEPCVDVAYDNGGDFCVPKLGEAVWIVFVGGDPNKPVYLGGWWAKETAPKETYDELDNYRIISYADCKIVMVNGKIHIETGFNGFVDIEREQLKLGTLIGDTEITVKEREVTIQGDLNVYGNINCSRVATIREKVVSPLGQIITMESSKTTTNSLYSQNIENGENIKTDTLDVNRISSTQLGVITADGITSNSYVRASGEVSGDSVRAGNIDLANHVHRVTTMKDGGTVTTEVPM